MMLPTAENCAHELIEVIPDLMQVIRSEIRRQRGQGLSVLQLRALAFVERNPGCVLSAVAEHVGLTLSSMSTQVSNLVQRGLVARIESVIDRRFVTLTLTETGYTRLSAVRQSAQASLAVTCAPLTVAERATLLEALEILRSLISSSPASSPASSPKNVMEK